MSRHSGEGTSKSPMGPPATPTKIVVIIKDLRNLRPPQRRLEDFKVDLSRVNWFDLHKYMMERKGLRLGQFSLALPGRVALTEERFKQLKNGVEIWILETIDQDIQQTVSTSVCIQPHYHTITQSGMYEYYDSRGIDSLVISLAELIDNSLAATRQNTGLRHIEIRYFDNGLDSMVIIFDNGKGMDVDGLNSWARFKYSRFEREKNGSNDGLNLSTVSDQDSAFMSFSSQDLPLRRPPPSTPMDSRDLPPPEDRIRRYLDSDINYFGAGGKQAIFNIGQHTTMISKTKCLKEVYEMTLSRSRFAEKAKINPKAVYQEQILIRPLGTERNPLDDTISEQIINEMVVELEDQYDSFTMCCIKDLGEKHKEKFVSSAHKREDLNFWTKQLARIYNYYLHGIKGNLSKEQGKKLIPPDLCNLTIMVQVFKVDKIDRFNYEKSQVYKIDLKQINNDLESLLVRKASDCLEFELEHTDFPNQVIEGIIRYYPYHHNAETNPRNIIDDDLNEIASISGRSTTNEDHLAKELQRIRPKPPTKEVFECFWHGRLIPQDLIDFEWSKPSQKSKDKVNDDCFGRISGALFTNSAFKVSQNKQSFMDLSKVLAQKDRLSFYKLSKEEPPRRLRTNFESDFYHWLKECHKRFDKQVHYRKFVRDAQRSEFLSLKKNSFSEFYFMFNEIEWKDKVLKKGDIIQTQKTKPMGLIGRVDMFLVPAYGRRDNQGNYMGPPGFVVFSQLPEEIYGKEADASKLFPFRQINMDASSDSIHNDLGKLHDKLPSSVKVTFPKGNSLVPGCQIKAGDPLPDMQIFCFNMNGDKLNTDKIPFKGSYRTTKIQAEILRVERDENGREDLIKEVEYDIAPFTKEHHYWIMKMEDGIKRVGRYRLICLALYWMNTRLSEDSAFTFPNGDPLPRADEIDFFVTAGPPTRFSIVETEPKIAVGQSLNLNIEFYDKFDNKAKPDRRWRPSLTTDRFKVCYSELQRENDKLILKDIKFTGVVGNNAEVILEIYIEGFEKKQEVAVRIKQDETLRRQQEETLRKEKDEAVGKKKEEAATKQQEEAFRKQREEVIRKRQEVAIRLKQNDMIRRQQEEAIRKKQEEAILKQQEVIRRQQEETSRKNLEETTRRQHEETIRKQQENLNKGSAAQIKMLTEITQSIGRCLKFLKEVSKSFKDNMNEKDKLSEIEIEVEVLENQLKLLDDSINASQQQLSQSQSEASKRRSLTAGDASPNKRLKK